MSYLAITAHTSVAGHLELNAHSYFIRVVLLSPVVSDTRQGTRTRLFNTAVNTRHGSIQSDELCDELSRHRRGSVQALCIPILAWQLFVRCSKSCCYSISNCTTLDVATIVASSVIVCQSHNSSPVPRAQFIHGVYWSWCEYSCKWTCNVQQHGFAHAERQLLLYASRVTAKDQEIITLDFLLSGERLALLTELVFFKAVALSYSAGDIHWHCWLITSSTISRAIYRPALLLDWGN